MNFEYSFEIISRNGGFWLNKDGWTFNLSPAEMIKIQLPPDTEGIDWFVREASRLKKIHSEIMRVTFSSSLFLGCDARFSYKESSFGGWVYSISGEFLEFDNFRKVWICPQSNLYFNSPPDQIYASLEAS
jgi:hypothetical protein